MSQATPEQIIVELGLEPHPEGGHYHELYRAPAEQSDRSAVTTIYYLLKANERSHWHRVDAVEIWHHYAGAPLELSLSSDGWSIQNYLLGPNVLQGQRPQRVVPKDAWQSARTTGDWTLVGCTVAPAFHFAGFELAPEDWSPGAG